MNVIVVGGGPAGCAAANALRALGHEALVLESDSGVGGRTRSIRRDGFVVDTGAVFLMASYRRALGLVRELGRTDELVAIKSPTGFVADDGTVHELRAQPVVGYGSLRLLSARDKLRLTGRSVAAAVDRRLDFFDGSLLAQAEVQRPLEQWARCRFGDRAYEYAVRPAIEPMWGIDCRQLPAVLWLALAGTAWSALPWRPPMLCLSRGMDCLPQWLAAAGPVRCRTTITSLKRRSNGVSVATADGTVFEADAAILATDSRSAANILQDARAAALGGLPYGASTHVAIGYERDPWPRLRQWAVVPVGPGTRAVLGIGRLSRKSPTLVPPGAEVISVYIGDAASARLPRDRAVQLAFDAADRLLGPTDAEPSFVHLFARRRAVPTPCGKTWSTARRVSASLPSRLCLAGDYFGPGGIESAIRSGEQAAASLHRTARRSTRRQPVIGRRPEGAQDEIKRRPMSDAIVRSMPRHRD